MWNISVDSLQTGNGKDTEQRDSLDHGQFKVPNGGHRQNHDDQVEEEPGQRLRMEEFLYVETVPSGDGAVPEEGQRGALEARHHGQGHRRRRREAEHDPGRGPHGAAPSEDAQVETQDAQLREGDRDEVDELEGEEALAPSLERCGLVLL